MTDTKEHKHEPKPDEKDPEDAREDAVGAPELESPENPAAPPEKVSEAPAEPEAEIRYGDVMGGVTEVASTPTVDSGVATTPSNRPDVFTPDVTISQTTGNDYGVATTPATRPTTF